MKSSVFYGILIGLIIWVILHLLYEGCATYRLGDFVRHTGLYEYTFFRMWTYSLQRSNTIIRRYGYSRHAEDIDFLLSITDHEKNIPCAMHVRIGDVIDNNVMSVENMWTIPDTDFVPNDLDVLGATSFIGNTLVETHGYVKSRAYYEKVCRQLVTKGIKEIYLSCGGIPVANTHKSRDYVHRLKSLLKHHGIHVVDISDSTADEALRILSNAQVFIPSGGGYSRLIQALVTKRNHIVIKPEDVID